ncbi:MAG: Mth938-like domain-containing protein [Rhodospirillales bacterium]
MSGIDVTPLVPAGRKVIQTYGEGRFRVTGETFDGSILIWPDVCLSWAARTVDDLDADQLHQALTGEGAPEPYAEILVIGCGAKFVAPPRGLRQDLRARGIAVEWMDTGAACRTFNVLLGEDRRAAGAILAID